MYSSVPYHRAGGGLRGAAFDRSRDAEVHDQRVAAIRDWVVDCRSIMMFSGLNRDGPTPFSCAAARPCASVARIVITRASGSVPSRRITASSVSPSTYGIVRYLSRRSREVVNADHVLMGHLAGEHELALESQLEIFGGGRIRLRRRLITLDRHRNAELVIDAWYNAPMPPRQGASGSL